MRAGWIPDVFGGCYDLNSLGAEDTVTAQFAGS